MKKKISLYIIMLLVVVVMPLQVKASNSVSITCDKNSYNVTDEATCVLKGSSTNDIISVSGSLYTGNPMFDIVSTVSNGWQGDADDGDIELYIDDEKTGTFDISTIKVKIKQGASLGEGVSTPVDLIIDDVAFGNVDGVEEDVASVTTTITFGNPNNSGSSEDEGSKTTTVTTTTKAISETTTVGTTTKTNGDANEKNPSTLDINIAFIMILLILPVVGVLVGKNKLKNKID